MFPRPLRLVRLPCLVGDEPEGREVLVLGGLGLNPDGLPGQLLEDEHLALLRVLDPRQPQVGLLPGRRLRLHHQPGQLQQDIGVSQA